MDGFIAAGRQEAGWADMGWETGGIAGVGGAKGAAAGALETSVLCMVGGATKGRGALAAMLVGGEGGFMGAAVRCGGPKMVLPA